jgi:hypothetical protein
VSTRIDGEPSASLKLTSPIRSDIGLATDGWIGGHDMNDFLNKPPVSEVRWVARVFGTLIALFALVALVENITEGRTIPEHLTGAGFLLLFAGCIVGWFRDLPAAVLILGAFLLILVTALAFPGKLRQVYFFAIPALSGFLFLYTYLASKKK